MASHAELACVRVPSEFGEPGVWRVCEEGVKGLSRAKDGSVSRADGEASCLGTVRPLRTSMAGRLTTTDLEWMAMR